MPRRRTGFLSRTISKTSASVERIELQREPHAQFWDAWNVEASRADGPLWVALGDSTSQGIGSADPTQSWIPLVLDRLRDTSGDPWRVINLGITGAQLGDIVEHQLPRLQDLRDAGEHSQLVTHLAGANNLLAPATWPRTLRDLRTILDAIPDRSVVARVGVSSPSNGLMARRINRTIEQEANQRPFHLFWPWSWPSKDGIGDDKWHPGPKGYSYMADLIFEQVQNSLIGRPSVA